jgi:hypothetical protein
MEILGSVVERSAGSGSHERGTRPVNSLLRLDSI